MVLKSIEPFGIVINCSHITENGEGGYMCYYQRLRDMREDADKNQTEIAKILGMQQTEYSRYERGERELPMHHFITLARFYNVSLDYLAGLIDEPKKIT